MSEIERFATQECCVGFEVVWEYDEGDYVKYEDHMAAIQDLKEQIWKLKDDLEAARREAGGYA